MPENLLQAAMSSNKWLPEESTGSNRSNRSIVPPFAHDHHKMKEEINTNDIQQQTVVRTQSRSIEEETTDYRPFHDEGDALFRECNKDKTGPFHPRNFFKLHERTSAYSETSVKNPRRWSGQRNSLQSQKRRSGSIDIMGLGGIGGAALLNNRRHGNDSLVPAKTSEGLDQASAFRDPTTQPIITDGEGHCSNQSSAVDSFFNSIRVPASFIVGTSFSELFTSYKDDKENNETTVQLVLQTICVVFQGFSFILSLSVIILSSSALVRGLTANFDPYAENGYELLFREFHLEFVCVRWAYNMSMFGFLLAVGAKILHEFELFNYESENFERSQLELGIAVVLILSAMGMHLFAVRATCSHYFVPRETFIDSAF